MTGGKHAMPIGTPKHAIKGCHAADGRVRAAGGSGARPALSALRQRVFRIIHPAGVPKLGGAVIAPDAPAWQMMIRAARTPACGVAVIVGVVFSGVGAAAPSLAHRLIPHSAPTLTPHAAPTLTPVAAPTPTPHAAPTPTRHGNAATTVRLGPSTNPAPVLGDIQLENPDRLGPHSMPTHHDEAPKDIPDLNAPIANPDLDAALTDLDQQADRDQAWASQHPAAGPATSCAPTCTDSTRSQPQEGPAPPPAGTHDTPSTTRPPTDPADGAPADLRAR